MNTLNTLAIAYLTGGIILIPMVIVAVYKVVLN